MDAEDLRKLATRMGVREEDVALALRVAKDDMAEVERLLAQSVHVIKGCYSAKTNRLNGGIIILVDLALKQIKRVRTLATYDTEFGAIAVSQPWEEIEKKIFEAEIKQNCVPAISHDLAGEMEYTLQEHISEVVSHLASGAVNEVESRLRRIICTCLGDSDVVITCAIDKMTQLAMKVHDQEIKPEAAGAPEAGAAEPAAAAPAAAAEAAPPPAPGEDRSLVLKTDVVLSPVTGVPVTSMNPGDFIMVRITDTRPQAAYIANLLHATDGNRTLPVRVRVRTIDRSESQRLIITTEFGPGVYGRTVVQEGLKIKVQQDDTRPPAESVKLPAFQILLIVGLATFVFALFLFVIYYFVALI